MGKGITSKSIDQHQCPNFRTLFKLTKVSTFDIEKCGSKVVTFSLSVPPILTRLTWFYSIRSFKSLHAAVTTFYLFSLIWYIKLCTFGNTRMHKIKDWEYFAYHKRQQDKMFEFVWICCVTYHSVYLAYIILQFPDCKQWKLSKTAKQIYKFIWLGIIL